jgi:hypothetical protein
MEGPPNGPITHPNNSIEIKILRETETSTPLTKIILEDILRNNGKQLLFIIISIRYETRLTF